MSLRMGRIGSGDGEPDVEEWRMEDSVDGGSSDAADEGSSRSAAATECWPLRRETAGIRGELGSSSCDSCLALGDRKVGRATAGLIAEEALVEERGLDGVDGQEGEEMLLSGCSSAGAAAASAAPASSAADAAAPFSWSSFAAAAMCNLYSSGWKADACRCTTGSHSSDICVSITAAAAWTVEQSEAENGEPQLQH